MDLLKLPRYELATLPTPLQPLERLSAELDVELWVKRDDLTGLAFGGNKTRKLELLVAAAIEQQADTLVTVGARQSNHCRQTAAAAAAAGLGCTLVLGGDPPDQLQGNVLLDQLLGADLRWAGEQPLDDAWQAAVSSLQAEGRRPYPIPYGGSNPLGVAAYALAIEEVLALTTEFDRIVLASSSGGTQAGLILGGRLNEFAGRITGISVEPHAAELRSRISELLEQTAERFELALEAKEPALEVYDEYLGGGYAVVAEFERAAVNRFARDEGLLLDPVYTGRAAGAMLDLMQRGVIASAEKVLFWHTGGTPALFAYAEELAPSATSS